MIRRILVALDADSDTPVAIQYAADIAQRHEAEITGLALIDMVSIGASSVGGGIGSMYLQEKVRANLTAEARDVASELVASFREALQQAHVPGHAQIEDGAPIERIVEDLNYHDLLVIGKVPHFFYSHPEQATKTLEEVVGRSVGPTLVAPDEHRPVERVLVAYDESPASSRALRRFLNLRPFGTELAVEILNVHGKGERSQSQLALQRAQAFMHAHGFKAGIVSVQSANPNQEILEYVERSNTDLLVVGAHVVSPLVKLASGSTTASFLQIVPVPLWLDS